jgi:hypothetical protein
MFSMHDTSATNYILLLFLLSSAQFFHEIFVLKYCKKTVCSSITTKTKFHIRITQQILGQEDISVFVSFFITDVRIRDFRLSPRCRWDLRSSGILRSDEFYFCTDVSGQPIGPVFKGQEVQEDWVYLTIEDGTDTLSGNVGTDLIRRLELLDPWRWNR